MKSIANSSIKKLDYPCLMRGTRNGSVVLFTADSKGTCVHAEGADVLGEYSPDWDTDNFELFNGTIALSND